MPLVTLADLRTRSRQRANMENSTFVTDVELTRLVNSHRYRLYNALSMAVPYYFSQDFAITTVPGQIPYALPADFRSAQVVYAVEQADQYRPLRNLTDFQRNVYRAPAGAYSVVLRYTPTPPPLVGDLDTLDGYSGFDEFIVAAVARDMILKEEGDVGTLIDEMAQLKAEIMATLPRDQGQPEYVTEVEYAIDWPYPYRQAVNAYQLRAGFLDLYAISPVWP
jgi:hypothetical protein